ncbi:MAG: hypothetical protein A2Z37_01500 [Chloroflexi bacterium RBG_19FT_COMBO_62_14]|nr:MAG: hypothetical protein A2Z37_01500 [Chloroflexi bacterium RBG_19FT_COMBO_62_14]
MTPGGLPGVRILGGWAQFKPASDAYPVLDTSDLQNFIRIHAIRGEVVFLPVETPTVSTAAAAVATSPDQIVKSLLFVVGGEPLLVVTHGLGRVDRRAIGRMLNVGRKQVHLADPETVLSVTGYPVGTLPPFGHLRGIRTLVDRTVLGHQVIYAGGGSVNALLRLKPDDLVRACGAELVDFGDQQEAGQV